MTALKEIKKAIEELREDMGYAYDKGDSRISNILVWCDALNAISPTLESLQRENAILQERTADYPTISAKLHDREKARDAEQKSCREAIARAEAAEAEVKRLREVLEQIANDAESPQQLYDRNGPQWTGADGNEYEDTSYFLAKCNELAASARTALASTGGEHHGN